MKKLFWVLLSIFILLFIYRGISIFTYTSLLELDNTLVKDQVTFSQWLEYKKRQFVLAFQGSTNDTGSQSDLVESMYITVDPVDLRELDENLPESGRAYKKGHLVYHDKIYDIKIRYRGDSSYHWIFDKKSYKIKLENDETIYKHDVLQLNNIKDPEMINEYIGNELAKEMGMLAIDQQYVEFYINGDYQGLYLHLEPIEKAFVETKKYPVGNIFTAENGGEEQVFGIPLNVYKKASAWNLKLLGEAVPDERKKYLNSFLHSLNSFLLDRKGMVAVKKFLDIPYFQSFTAWMTLAQVTHIDHFHNIILYHDPTRGKYVQIPWDPVAFQADTVTLDFVTNELLQALHMDPTFIYEKNKILWKYLVGKDVYTLLQKQSKELKEELKPSIYNDKFKGKAPMRLPLSNEEFEVYFEEYLGNLEKYKVLKKEFENTALTYRQKNIGGEVLLSEVSVDGVASIEISEIRFGDKCQQPEKIVLDRNRNKQIDEDDRVVDSFTGIILHPGRNMPDHSVSLVPASHIYSVIFTGVGDRCTLFGVSGMNAITEEKVEGQPVENIRPDKEGTFTIHPWLLEIEEEHERDNALRKIAQKYPSFIQRDDMLEVPEGTYTIDSTILIPEGVTTVIQPGASLLFSPGQSFISFGKVLAQGTAEKKIIIKSTHAEKPFGVFATIDNGAKGSRFSYLDVENGSETWIGGMYISGMFNSYHVPDVIVEHSTFRGAVADDALNFKNSDGIVRDSLFENNSADAIDFDFMEGWVERNHFVNNGNDSVDTSGSTTVIVDNVVEGSGDKCFSFGEKSSPIAVNNVLKNCHIGVEVKDESAPIILNTVIMGNDIGINSYQKKEHFGSAHGTFVNTLLYNNKEEITFYNSFEGDKLPTDQSDIQIRYSNIPGGYEGEGNVDESTIPESLSLVGKGNVEVLKEIRDYSEDTAPIGLLQN